MSKSRRTFLRDPEVIGGFGAVGCMVLAYSLFTKLDVIGWLYQISRHHSGWPVDHAVVLFVCLSFAFLFLSMRRSQQLRREIGKREAAESEAQLLARHDALTGLPNRRALADELQRSIARANRGATLCALLIVDLDRFKPVNDLYGHGTGDRVLRELAVRLRRVLRTEEILARLGGDEFAVVIEYPIGGNAPRRVAKRIITAASQPFEIANVTFQIGATVGIAVCPADGADSETLLHAADVALYRAKREGRGTFRFFEQSMDIELRTRAALEADLRRAIANGEIRPYYQPIVALGEQRLLGFEVLARWVHPARGMLPPGTFIPIAEDTGLVGDLTYALLRQACQEAKAWPPDLSLAVNISPSQLRDKWLPERLLAILTETGFAPARFEVEITENALISDIETARTVLSSLQNVGIRVALDDFGTGYSSLYHLRELRFDKIKIDRSLVQSMMANGESQKIVDAIVSLSKSLGLPTTAEGIEDTDKLDQLTLIGCEYGQGFHFGAPMPAGDVAQFIEAGQAEPDSNGGARLAG